MIYLNIDIAELLALNDTLKPKLEQAIKNASQSLALQTHSHILEEVQTKLHSTREKYSDALSFHAVNDNTFIINLDKSMSWLEDGMPEHQMLDSLLKSPKAKVSKDGHKYITIPFRHNKGPTQQTQAARDLTSTIKQELQNRKIPYGKIERDEHGVAKTGLLHSFDIKNRPVRTSEGPGQGHGPMGAPRQGSTGIPFLQGVRIYQKQTNTGIKRGIMTFRVASSKQRGGNAWKHPGIEARDFFSEAETWALAQWDKIAEDILNEFKSL